MGWPVLGVSRSDSLGYFFLGTGWAAALSLLIIHRAGMANQASTDPGAEVGRVRNACVCIGEGVIVFELLWVHLSISHLPAEWPWVCLRRHPFPKRCPHAPPLRGPPTPNGRFSDGPLSSLLLLVLPPCSQRKARGEASSV